MMSETCSTAEDKRRRRRNFWPTLYDADLLIKLAGITHNHCNPDATIIRSRWRWLYWTAAILRLSEGNMSLVTYHPHINRHTILQTATTHLNNHTEFKMYVSSSTIHIISLPPDNAHTHTHLYKCAKVMSKY